MNYCREQGLKVYGSGNGLYVSTWNQLREKGALGKGLPDLFILIPPDRSGSGMTAMLCIEVKSATGRATKEQKEFIDMVNSIKGDVYGVVVHSLEEAITVLSQMICEKPELTDEEVIKIIENL